MKGEAVEDSETPVGPDQHSTSHPHEPQVLHRSTKCFSDGALSFLFTSTFISPGDGPMGPQFACTVVYFQLRWWTKLGEHLGQDMTKQFGIPGPMTVSGIDGRSVL